MEHDRGEDEYERVQPLGMEHRGRLADAADREREHANDPGGDHEPEALVTRLQPVRAQPGRIGPDGGADATISSGLLPER